MRNTQGHVFPVPDHLVDTASPQGGNLLPSQVRTCLLSLSLLDSSGGRDLDANPDTTSP